VDRPAPAAKRQALDTAPSKSCDRRDLAASFSVLQPPSRLHLDNGLDAVPFEENQSGHHKDLCVESFKPRLVSLDQLRLECSVAIPRGKQVEVASSADLSWIPMVFRMRIAV
jgi:hypothetical protein